MKIERLELLRRTAEKIDTGTDAPETSRALVVFNLTEQALRGAAVFHAEMSWRRGASLPPIVVTEMDGQRVPSVVGDLAKRDDERGRSDRQRLAFDIQFAVTDAPANGWKTYLAWFVPEDLPEGAPQTWTVPELGLTVVETTRHGGELPARGTF